MPSTALFFHFFAAPCCPLLPVISPPTWRWFTTISRPTTDLAASNDVAQLLYPEWRNFLEKPFLWLGDFHPYLFTNLLRSFLDDGDDDDDDGDHEVGETCSFCDTPWQILMAWKNPSETLMAWIEQIECACGSGEECTVGAI
ncbi:protein INAPERTURATE POLLEN1-like [Vitis riparia]|uniref:protein INAPERTURATE POLLEN1-like n=1 Tax=Vitis riparia TaxID=96939 RepID=UPI00155AA3DB|nr:protein INAPERTURATE POLLEN1-like [Vitis riparia]